MVFAILLTLICHSVIWEGRGGGGVNGGDPCALVYKEARLPGSESQLLCMSLLKSLNLCRPTTHVYH